MTYADRWALTVISMCAAVGAALGAIVQVVRRG